MRRDDVKDELKAAGKEASQWEDLWRHAAWRDLVAYLEARYLELGEKDCQSLRELADRNGRMAEIRAVFGHVRHKFQYREALERELKVAELEEDDGIPDRAAWLG